MTVGVLVDDILIVGVTVGVLVDDILIVGVIDAVIEGGGVTGGVLLGVILAVTLGIVEQSVTVLTFPEASNVTTYLVPPSINNENPPGFDT